MQSNKDIVPEVRLLNSIIDEELKEEKDAELKKIIKTKANNFHSLLSFLSEKNLDDNETKRKIKELIEGE